MSTIESLKPRVHDSVKAAEDLLTIMMTSTLSPALMNVHVGHINKMKNLTYNVASELLGIKPMCRDRSNDMELKEFSTSMIDIGHRASNHYTDLCSRVDPTHTANIHIANHELQVGTQDIQRDTDINTCPQQAVLHPPPLLDIKTRRRGLCRIK